jgi:hypothetical protein
VAIHDWTFLLGPSWVLGINSFLLAYLMYRSELVPRLIAVLGLLGGSLVCDGLGDRDAVRRLRAEHPHDLGATGVGLGEVLERHRRHPPPPGLGYLGCR